jgi:regulator of cell morphogenesis and NO signaling
LQQDISRKRGNRRREMGVIAEKTVRELALENPAASRLFEKLGIDYCCGGNRSLEEACRMADLRVDSVLQSLQAEEQKTLAAQPQRDWVRESLAELMAHIQATHHKYTREQIARLGPLFEKVCSAHGKRHPELLQMRGTFQGLGDELLLHMMKEERVLFPFLLRMEEAVLQKEPMLPAPFGSVRNPIAMMTHEHESAGQALRALSQASQGYTPPEDACATFQALYGALSEFERDLHQHIHLENNILFPRAAAMEAAG